MKGSTKGTGMLRAYSGDPAPSELPHEECHREARENPWALEEEGILEVLDFTQPPLLSRHLRKDRKA